MDLGNILEEAKKQNKDPRVQKFLEDLLELERTDPYFYKGEIQRLLEENRGEVENEDN